MIRWFIIAAVLMFVSSVVRAAEATPKEQPLVAIDLVEVSSRANHNKGVELYEMKRLNEAEEFFRKALTANPDLRESYYYLGSIEHVERFNFDKALEFYSRGCDLKESRSCDGARQVKADILAKLSNSGRVTASTSQKTDEAALWDQIRVNYLKNGMPSATADNTIGALKKSIAKLDAPTRLNNLKKLEEGTR